MPVTGNMDVISLIKAGKEKDAVLLVAKDHDSDSTALEEYNDEVCSFLGVFKKNNISATIHAIDKNLYVLVIE